MNFNPTYIYIKECNHCGLKYLGKSCLKTEKDVCKYTGSGTYWKTHLKKHKSKITTTIINYFREWEKDYCKIFCLETSKYFDIIKSKKWANLIYENGIDGADLGENNPMFGKKHSNKVKKQMSKNSKGKKHTDKTKELLSILNTGKYNKMYGKTHSEESKRKMSESSKGKKLTNEHKQKISNKLKGRVFSEETLSKLRKPQEKIKCPYCNKIGGISCMKRWNFDKCKNKIDL